ncbi:MAG: carboxypeptidase regulatory-like domain-containing protein [Bryobacteraceae bacterium]
MKRVVASLFLSFAGLLAQSTTGALVGTVSDPSGGVIAGVKIRVINDGTGVTVETTSNTAGDYTVPNLPAATYRVRAEFTGFRTVEVASIRLLLNQTVRTDIRLEPGAVEQSVNVTAAPPVVQSETSSVASNVDAHSVVTLPLNGRTLDRLLLVTAGNTSDSPSNPKLAGSLHWGGNFFTIDGVSFNDLGNGGAAYSYRTALSTTPSVDTIQEFKIETTNAKAEHEGSAAVSIISKGGTNQFHGSVFEFNRNKALAANAFFSNANNVPRPPFNRNEFGATVGGPVIKNKTFFFGSYEGLRQRQSTSAGFSFGTQAMRQGDFTGLPVIADPLSGTSLAARTPFPNQRIPTARLDSRSLKLLEFVPLPNAPGSAAAAGTGVNYFDTVPNIIGVNRYTARGDHNVNATNNLSVVLSYSKGDPYFVYNGGPRAYGNFSDGGYITKSAGATYTRVIGGNKTNEFRYAYFNHASIRIGQNTSFDPSSLFPSLYKPLPIGGLPSIGIAGFNSIGDSGGSDRAPQITQELIDNFSFVRGAHTFKTGIDVAFSRVSSNPAAGGGQFGSFSFANRYSGSGLGAAYADFLLGFPISAVRGTPSLVNLLYFTRYGAYFQDDWRVSSKLTLNLGMRYTLQTQTQERDGSFANFDFGAGKYVIRTAGGQLPRLALPRLVQAYPYVGSEANNWGSDVILADHNNLGPRIGFAYRPFGGNKTVVRGGYGIFYNIIPVYIGIRQISLTNTPFQLSESFDGGAGSPLLSLANPFPGGGAISPNPNITAVNRRVTNTYAQQWNMTLEREIIKDFGLRFSYIGNKGTSVPWYTYERNLPDGKTPGATLQALRPYQPFASISTLDPNGSSITHQLQIELIRRWANGLYLQTNYTLNKTLDNVPIVGTPQNPYNAALDRGNGDQIRRHVAYTSITYDLPFGKGRKFAAVTGPANYLIGGWQVAGILQFRGGTPFTPGFAANSLPGWYANRANVVSNDLYGSQRNINQWFNPAAFAIPAPYTFGNAARNMLWSPGQRIIDLSLLKSFSFGESREVQFRGEFFNLPNTPSFSAPGANLSAPGSLGKITGTTVEARVVQFGLKLLF